MFFFSKSQTVFAETRTIQGSLLKFLAQTFGLVNRLYSLKNWVVLTQISKIWVTTTQIF